MNPTQGTVTVDDQIELYLEYGEVPGTVRRTAYVDPAGSPIRSPRLRVRTYLFLRTMGLTRRQAWQRHRYVYFGWEDRNG